VEGKHPQAVEALAERMLGHKRLEPTDQLQVAARLEVSLDRKLESREAELL